METCADCGKPFNGINDIGWVQNDPFGKTTVVRKFHSGCGDPLGIKRRDAELDRCKALLRSFLDAWNIGEEPEPEIVEEVRKMLGDIV